MSLDIVHEEAFGARDVPSKTHASGDGSITCAMLLRWYGRPMGTFSTRAIMISS